MPPVTTAFTPCWDFEVFPAEVLEVPELGDDPEVFDVPCDVAVVDAEVSGELPLSAEPF